MRDPNELDPDDVKELLDMLRVRLISKGVSGRLKVVGGAAIASRYPNDPDVRVTRDIDALYWPKEEVEAVAKEIALERNLSKDWLNDRARSFAPMSEDRSEINTFEVNVAELPELVAMKLAASREQDLNDLEILAWHMGITRAEEIVEIAYEQYGVDTITLNESREDYMLIAEQVMRRVRRRRKYGL